MLGVMPVPSTKPRATHKSHEFACRLVWSGAKMGGTTSYAGYSREYRVEFDGKPVLNGSAAPAFRGTSELHNPEDLLVAALSACHLLSYLALCSMGGIVVVDYSDDAWGKMEPVDGRIRFTEVLLRPKVIISPTSSLATARALHGEAHATCFIANSVNFPVKNEPTVQVAGHGQR
jgi:organic hydroperoxide reductase OsmC/OhrA